jgi:SHS2 domain-containing protein
MMPYSYEFLDEVAVADLAFDARGDTVQELFHAATGALFEALANPATIGSTWHQTIERHDEDPSELLFDWLSDLVYWKDAAGVVYSKADLKVRQEAKGGWRLNALLSGEPVNRTQELRSDVKGVTKHLYRVGEQDGCWTARVVLDV